MKDMRMNALAMFAVAVMLAVSAVPIMSSGDADASSEYWTYTVSLNSDGTVSVTGSGSAVASPTAAGAVGTTGAYTSASGSNVGSWGFDSKGYGPFGSFYAAFDASNGNKMICILNPNDLDKSIDGNITLSTAYSSSVVNIMWVLPTVYWSVDSNGKLILTNDPSSGGKAYAHTIDGTIYNYMAIGVYEASSSDATSSSQGTTSGYLTSSSGKLPFANNTRSVLRTMANSQTVATVNGSDSNGHAMLWNVYMWQLYRFAVITVGGGMNSQQTFGNGDVYNTVGWTNYFNEGGFGPTGTLDSSGPYAGTVGNSDGYGNDSYHSATVKAFIEDAWGSFEDFVDGVVIYADDDGNISMFASQSSNLADDDDYSSNDYPSLYPTRIGILPDSSYYGIASTSSAYPAFWGLPVSTVAEVGSSTTFDFIYVDSGSDSSNPYGLIVGGYSGDFSVAAPACGLSYMDAFNVVDDSGTDLGGRLAFVYSAADSAAPETTHTITYMLDSTTKYTSVGVADGDSISVPTAPTMTNKVFGGWYTDSNCTKQYEFGTAVTENLTLYAKWYSVLVFSSTPSANGIYAYTNK